MVVCCPKLQHEIWRNLDWHSQYQNELNFYQDYRILVFLNLHFFFICILQINFITDMGLSSPSSLTPQKNLKPLLLPFPFCKRNFERLEMKVLYKVYRVSIRLHFLASIHACRERSNYLRRLKLSLLLLPKDTLPRSLLALVSRRL